MNQDSHIQHNSRLATVYMLAAAFTFSLFPIVNIFGMKTMSALFLSAMGLLVSGVFFLTTLLCRKNARDLALRALKNPYCVVQLLFSGVLLTGSYVSFAYSLKYLNPALATIVFESHLILLVFASPIFVKRLRSGVSTWGYTMAIVSFIGVVVLGLYDISQNVQISGAGLLKQEVTRGLIMAFLGSLLVAGNVITRQMASERLRTFQKLNNEFDLSLVANSLSRISPLVILLLFGGSVVQSIVSLNLLDVALLLFYGIVVIGLNNIFFLMAVNTSPSSSINGLRYAGPVMSLLIMWALGAIDSVEFPIALGFSIVVLSSFFTVMRPFDDLASTVMVIYVVLCGATLHFVSGSSIDDYYSATIAPLVIFTLVVVFVIERIKKAQKQEDEIEVEIAALAKDDPAILKVVRAARKQASIDQAIIEISNAKIDSVIMQEKLRKFVLSKMSGVSVGEWMSLIGSAVVTLIASIFYRSNGFLFDLYALVLTSSVVYLLFLVVSDELERREGLIDLDNPTGFSLDRILRRHAQSSAGPAILAVLVMLLQVTLLYG